MHGVPALAGPDRLKAGLHTKGRSRVGSVALRQTGAASSGATNPRRAPVREIKAATATESLKHMAVGRSVPMRRIRMKIKTQEPPHRDGPVHLPHRPISMQLLYRIPVNRTEPAQGRKKTGFEFAKRPVKALENPQWKDLFEKTVDTSFEFVKDNGSSELDI